MGRKKQSEVLLLNFENFRFSSLLKFSSRNHFFILINDSLR